MVKHSLIKVRYRVRGPVWNSKAMSPKRRRESKRNTDLLRWKLRLKQRGWAGVGQKSQAIHLKLFIP